MFRKLSLLCLALALFSMAGGQFAALQTIAWAKMLRGSIERTGDLALSLEQTFDGEHPCELCLDIAAAKRQEVKAQAGESKEAPLAPQIASAEKNNKATLCETEKSPVRIMVSILCWPSGVFVSGPLRDEQPPTPPPRLLCA